MLSVEIRVNGSLIAAFAAINRGAVDSTGRYRYEYQGVRFPVDFGPPVATNGFIEHMRQDGAEVLVAALCRALAEVTVSEVTPP